MRPIPTALAALLGVANAARSAVSPSVASAMKVEGTDGEAVAQRRLQGSIAFRSAAESGCIPDPSVECSSVLIPVAGSGPLTIPCGECVSFDTNDGEVTLEGLDIQGKLVFPDDHKVTIYTPFVFVQGEMKIRNTKVMSRDNESVKFVLTGIDGHTMSPHSSNQDMCSSAAGICNFGKKAFVVAGGKLDIQGYNFGPSCPTWTRIHSYEEADVLNPGVGEYPEPVDPPAGCSSVLIDSVFNGTSYDGWTAGEDSSAGASRLLDALDGMEVSNRIKHYQGPTVDLTHKMGCVKPDEEYLLTVKLMLTKDGDANDGTTPTTCASGEGFCVKVNNWILYGDETSYRQSEDMNIQVAGSGGNYGEWTTFTAIVSFAPEDLTPDVIYNALLIDGPEDGVSVHMSHAKLALPKESSYPNPNDVCQDLVSGGDAEPNGDHPFPAYFSDLVNTRVLIKDDGDARGRYFSLVGRNDQYDTVKWPLTSPCIKKNQVYKMSAMVRVRSDVLVSLEWEVRKCKDEDCESYEDYTLLHCPEQKESDGWVLCEGEINFNEEMELDAVAHHLRFEVADADIVDVDDVSLSFVRGSISGIVVPDDVSQCWGGNSQAFVTSHTMEWDGGQLVEVTDVTPNNDGTATIHLADAILPATTMTTPGAEEMAAEIAMMTRNIIIEGEPDPNLDHGGYAVVYYTTGVDQIIEGAQFVNMGQLGISNRFNFHFRRCGFLNGTSFSYNSIMDSNQRGLVVQDTHGATFQYNVAVDNMGHTYVTMDGSERENHFLANLGAGTKSVPSEKKQYSDYDAKEDSQPTTFFFRGPENIFNGNVAAGSYRNGFWFHLMNKVSDESESDYGSSMDPRKRPILSFEGNVAHSNRYTGLKVDYLHVENSESSGIFSDFTNTRIYRNKDKGFQSYKSENFAIKGGFFADNRGAIDLRYSVGIYEISDLEIKGETQHQRDLVSLQDVSVLYCSSTTPVRGIYLPPYQYYKGHVPTHIKNVHFSDFDEVSECDDSVPIFFRKEHDDQHFNFHTYLTNVTADTNTAYKIDACDASSRYRDIVLHDLDGSFDPDPTSTFSGIPASIVSNQAFMVGLANEPCQDYPDMCMSYCPNTCFRTVTWTVDWHTTEDWYLRVTDSLDREVFVPGNINEGRTIQSQSQYYYRRKFSVSLASGTYTAEFVNSLGETVWPKFAEEFWEADPPCEGHANKVDVTLIKPDLVEGECDDLIFNGDFEAEDSVPWKHWEKYSGTLSVGIFQGVDGSNALEVTDRSKSYYGPMHMLDTRCVNATFMGQFEFRAQVKLMDGTNPWTCDPNESSGSGGCPEVQLMYGWYDDTKASGLSRSWPYPKAEVVRPFVPGQFNLLQGVFTIDDYKGQPFEDVASFGLLITNFQAGIDLILDDVTLTPVSGTCDGGLLWNGDFSTGTSEYWDTYNNDAAKLEIVDGYGDEPNSAVKVYDRTSSSRGLSQYIRTGCMEEGELYHLKAKFKTEKDNVHFPCNPDSTDDAVQCPGAYLKADREGHTDTYDRVSYATTALLDGDWMLMEGIIEATHMHSIATEMTLYFAYEDTSLSTTYDDITFTHLPRDCSNLIRNPSFNEGTASFWRINSHGSGRLAIFELDSNYALRVTERSSSSIGLRYDVDHQCIEAGQDYAVNAKIRLLDSDGNGVWCDPADKSTSSDINCPPVYLRAEECDGTNQYIYLWNGIFDVEWDANGWNDFSADFIVDENVATCKTFRIEVRSFNVNWDVVIDDFFVTKATETPTGAPTPQGTRAPTASPSSAPTIDGTYPPTFQQTSSPTMTATDCLPPGSNRTISAGFHALSKVGPDQVCTLAKRTIDNTGDVVALVPVARSFDNNDWQTAAGKLASASLGEQGWKCYENACEIELLNVDINEEYILTSYEHTLLPQDEIARFLESVTFGPKKSDIVAWDTSDPMDESMALWVKDQMNHSLTPITSHREYWRRRTNALWQFPEVIGTMRTACEPNARWRKATFSTKDRSRRDYPHTLTIQQKNSTAGETKIMLSIDGNPRTIVDQLRVKVDGVYTSYDFNSSYPYSICKDVLSNVGASLYILLESGSCAQVEYGNPHVDFTGFEGHVALTLALPEIGTGGASALQEIDSGGDQFILLEALDDMENCPNVPDVLYDDDQPIMGKMPDGTWLHYDPRLKLEENTLGSPIADGGGAVESITGGDTECSNAPRTFLNFEQCILSTEDFACGEVASPVTEILLDDANINQLQSLTGRYIYGILGLEVRQVNSNGEETYASHHPCTGGTRTRWEKSATCDNPTNLREQTQTVLSELITTYGDDDQNANNNKIRDIYFPDTGTCHADDMGNVEIQIDVNGECWTHVHPEHLSVYDMTYWTQNSTHPGNLVALGHGHYNPIMKWMDLQGSATLTFPSTHPTDSTYNHPMDRWEMHHVKFDYVGRMYDTVRFRDLPNELRRSEVAVHYGATGDVGGSGILVCGSPGEVTNDPSLGDVFDATNDDDTDSTSSGFFSRQREVTWTMSVMSAEDQLRQRAAWALAQVLVVVTDAIRTQDRNTEIFLAYYDIFVRHAFGNYRDILREISYSPLMAENLSYLQSKSHAYVRERDSILAFADENFAREIMQLFTIGMLQLNIDGSPKLDADGNVMPTYTNQNIMEFARVWTGFDYQTRRGNTEDYRRSDNRLDPMKIDADWRDKFPKQDLTYGYIGDGYPLCVDLPSQMFLRPGAQYRLLGRSPLPELMEDNAKFLDDVTMRRFVLDDSSHLKAALCGEDTSCQAPEKNLVTLDSKLTCVGIECDVDTVRVVQAGDNVFFEYVRPPCVELAFFNDAKMLNKRKKTDAGTICGNPLLPVAQEACCGGGGFGLEATMSNTYDGERMTFFTAQNKCGSLCEYNEVVVESHKSGYHWTDGECNIKIKVDGTDPSMIAIVYSMNAHTSKAMHVDDDTLNFFSILWDGDAPNNAANSCANSACSVLPDGGCTCPTHVSEEPVFSSLPLNADDVISQLSIGGVDISSFDSNTYDPISGNGFIAHTVGGVINSNTVFEAVDDKGVKHLLKNVRSTVSVPGAPGFSFRNTPHFVSMIPTETTVRDAQYETEAALDHYFRHDTVAPFLSIRLIQRFGTSNPTPNYVMDVAMAFKSGTYNSPGGQTFGDGKYGNLEATFSAIVLHPEARSVVLDADPSGGSLREPLIKIIAVMRSMEYALFSGNKMIQFENLEDTIGQLAHKFPTVFSFFLPEYIPAGRLNSASLVSPESMVYDMPKIVNWLNGIFSLSRWGLEDKDGGFGRNGQPAGDLAFVPEGTWGTGVVDELATLLTAGRLSSESRAIVQAAYDDIGDPTEGLKLAQQLIATTPEFHSTNLVRANGLAREIPTPSTSGDQSYKAVVYLMFSGGCDSYNMLIPHTCTAEDNMESLTVQYSEVRQQVALSTSLEIDAGVEPQPCQKFGIHPDLGVLQDLYQNGEALFIANAGVLTKAVNKTNYRTETVTQLFAHNTMQREAKRIDPFDAFVGSGVCGRMGDVLNAEGLITNAFSIDSNSVVLYGEPGVSASPSSVGSGGIKSFNPNPITDGAAMRETIEDLNKATQKDSGFFAETWSSLLHDSLERNEKLDEAISAATITANFPDSSLGRDFEIVSKLIQTHELRGANRDLFYVSTGGFDTHSDVEVNLAARFNNVNASLTAFVAELKTQGLWENVVLVESSDFARTLTPNSGDGTDHAWGGNYFVIGGGLDGGRILGEYPNDITDASPLNVGRGRIIPTTPYDSVWNGVAEWMGVTSGEGLQKVCPNRDNFDSSVLFTKGDLFGAGARERERKAYLRK